MDKIYKNKDILCITLAIIKGVEIMDIDRARKIISSTNRIDVTYNGQSVWINSINPNNGKAFVKTLNGNNEHHQVSVSELIEQ